MSCSQIYQHYQDYIEVNDTVWQLECSQQNQYTAAHYQTALAYRMQVNQFDSDIVLSRLQGRGQGNYCSVVENFNHHFALFIMLAGTNHFSLKKGKTHTVQPEQVWLVQGNWDNVQETIAATQNSLAAIHLDFSLERLQRWQDDGIFANTSLTNQSFSKDAGNTVIQKLSNNIDPIKRLTSQLLHQPFGQTGLSQLELEANTLSLTKTLLHLYFCNPSHMNNFATQRISKKHASQIDDAVDIIQADFTRALSITSLAKQVGMNECYLKQNFKSVTGETIAQFIRRLRLECAFRMLSEENKTIKETMYFVGYSHFGHFNNVFKRQFGITPKQAKQYN